MAENRLVWDLLEAKLNGVREVAKAITVSTITTVGIFLPISFVGGIVGVFFLPFGLAVTFAMLASLVVALTVVPVLAYLFMDHIQIKVDDTGEPPETIWQRLYTPVLALALRGRATKWGTLGIALVLSMAAMLGSRVDLLEALMLARSGVVLPARQARLVSSSGTRGSSHATCIEPVPIASDRVSNRLTPTIRL